MRDFELGRQEFEARQNRKWITGSILVLCGVGAIIWAYSRAGIVPAIVTAFLLISFFVARMNK